MLFVLIISCMFSIVQSLTENLVPTPSCSGLSLKLVCPFIDFSHHVWTVVYLFYVCSILVSVFHN